MHIPNVDERMKKVRGAMDRHPELNEDARIDIWNRCYETVSEALHSEPPKLESYRNDCKRGSRRSVSFTLTDVDEYIASLPYTDEGISVNMPEHDKADIVDFYEWLVKQNRHSPDKKTESEKG